jgi:release factor glutamine methyltransferase
LSSVGEVLAEAAARISAMPGIDVGGARIEARALLCHALHVDRAWLISHEREPLPEPEAGTFERLVGMRVLGEPVAYVTGQREFFGLQFVITPAVLIPRPESELLVEEALARLPAGEPCRVLDLGTGSGAVAIAIKANRRLARVTASDSSAEALAVARENARRLLAETPSRAGTPDAAGRTVGEEWGRSGNTAMIRLVTSDWFSAFRGERFDLIVSNPPYVAKGDPHLDQGDLRFEPRIALVAGPDGLDCIRGIVAQSHDHLEQGGWLMFEHGYDQAADCRNLLRVSGFKDVYTARDLSGIERVSGGRWLTP